MAHSAPQRSEAQIASLDRSTRVRPKLEPEDFRPLESFSDLAALGEPRLGFCPHLAIRSAMVVGDVDGDLSRIDFLAGCRRWECVVCGPKKRWQLIKRIELGQPNRFMTLSTSPRENETPRAVFVRTSKRISKLFRWIKKSDPEVAFARILESTKNGFPHYHFALRSKWISQANLANEWERLTGARVVDIRKLFGKHIRYLAKYVTKNDKVLYTRQRVSFSRNWPKLPVQKLDEQLAEWEQIYNDDVENWAESIIAHNHAIDIGNTAIGHCLEPSRSDLAQALLNEWQSRFWTEAALKKR